MRNDLVDSRIDNLPNKVKPYVLSVWRDEDILQQVVFPKCPVVVFYSGPNYNNKQVELDIRRYQDKYIFAAYRCFENNPPSLSLTNGTIPCVVLSADFLSRYDERRFIQLTKDKSKNAQSLEELFKLFENHEVPNWLKVVKNADSYQETGSNEFCLLIASRYPLSNISQLICSKFSNYRERMNVVLVLDDHGTFTDTHCRFYENNTQIMEQSVNSSLEEFLNKVFLYMNEIPIFIDRTKYEETCSGRKVKLQPASAYIEICDEYKNEENEEFIMLNGIYASPKGIGSFRCGNVS
ncbi:hypothetical protein ACOME3_006860 [Neoechinorhynchus agilis]